MYVFELKQNHYLQKCGHVGVFYTKTHKYKIRYKVENFEACYITEKRQSGEKGVQKVSVECGGDAMQKRKKERFYLYFYRADLKFYSDYRMKSPYMLE